MRFFEDDLPSVNAIVPPPFPEGFKLREIQEIAHANLQTAWIAGAKRPVLMAATGSGKTKLAGYLIHRMLTKNPAQRVGFVVPRETLLQQAYEEFTEFFGFEASVIQAIDDRLDLRKQIQVCTIQTLGRRLKKNPVFQKLYFGMVFIDEAHIEFADRKLISSDFVVGLTATPYARRMGLYYDKLVKTVPATKLCEQGVIVPLSVMSARLTTQIDRSQLHTTSTGEYVESEEQQATCDIIANVVEEYENSNDMKGRKFIGFAKTIKSCISLCDEFTAKGIRVGYVHSKMTKDDCQAILDLFRAGMLDGIWSVVKLIEGFDFPAVDALIIATVFAPSKNDPETPNALTRYVQMLGRVRRKHKGKSYGLVHDHGGNYERYGNPDFFEIGFDELLTGKEPKEKVDGPPERKIKKVECSVCGTVVQGRRCPRCLAEMKTFSEVVEGEIVEYVEGKMVQVTPKPFKNKEKKKPKQMTKDQKQDLYSGLKFTYQDNRIDRGLSPLKDGFVARQYKTITGVWPRGINQEVSRETEIGKNAAVYLNIIYQKSKGKRK